MKKLSLILFYLIVSFAFSGQSFSASTGDKIIPFKAQAMNGKMIDLGKISRKKPVMLFFWASW